VGGTEQVPALFYPALYCIEYGKRFMRIVEDIKKAL